ncbi:MAG: hypothetical protein V1736_05820, partial [Pseudomonadota bacterium]
MKRLAIFITVFLLLLVAAGCNAEDEIFRFAVFSDSRGQGKADTCAGDNFGVSRALDTIVKSVLIKNVSH